ncbi:hypothetical protein JW890_00850 [candidate division WOR-3 bacterium]|nr:hypothetical protein [candidate division WOR-3 bacterium]
MKNKIFFLIVFTVLLSACEVSNNGNSVTERITIEDPEHHMKDSPDILVHDSTVLYTGWYFVLESENDYMRQLDKTCDTFYIDPNPIVSANNFTSFEIIENDENGLNLIMRLDEKGTENWSAATEKAIGKRIAFILDNRLLCVKKIYAQVTNGTTTLNPGTFTQQELDNYKTILESER